MFRKYFFFLNFLKLKIMSLYHSWFLYFNRYNVHDTESCETQYINYTFFIVTNPFLVMRWNWSSPLVKNKNNFFSFNFSFEMLWHMWVRYLFVIFEILFFFINKLWDINFVENYYLVGKKEVSRKAKKLKISLWKRSSEREIVKKIREEKRNKNLFLE